MTHDPYESPVFPTGSIIEPDDPQHALAEPHPNRAPVVIAAIVVLLALAMLVGFLLLRRGVAEEPGTASSPTEAVQEYLTALAAGDAATALTYSAVQPADRTFMTQEFLTASMKAHPLTSITVPSGQSEKSPAEINATYTLGGQPVEATFTVHKHGKAWLLDGGFLVVNLADLVATGVPLTLDGQELDPETAINLFPGIYTLASADPMLQLQNGTFAIPYPETPSLRVEIRFALSDEGVSRLQQAAATHLGLCLAKRELQPAGCGFGWTDTKHGVIDPTTITWELLSDAEDIAAIQPQLDPNSTTSATAPVALTVRMTGVSTDKKYRYDAEDTIAAVHADFSNPQQIRVTFE